MAALPNIAVLFVLLFSVCDAYMSWYDEPLYPIGNPLNQPYGNANMKDKRRLVFSGSRINSAIQPETEVQTVHSRPVFTWH